MKMKVILFYLQKAISGYYFKENNSDLVLSKFIAGHMTKSWFLKLWITSFWTQILLLNFKGKYWKDDVVTFAAHLRVTQMFNKIQAKRSFGHHVGGAHNNSFLMLRIIHKLKTELKWNSDFFKSLAKVAVEDYSVWSGKQAKSWFQDWDSIVQWSRNVHVTTLYMKKSLV